MSCEMVIEQHCVVAWIPFNNTFTPEGYVPRGNWTGVLLQTGRYQSANGGETPGLGSIELTDASGGHPTLPEKWDWINIVPTDLMGLGEPMERAHLEAVRGKEHAFHQFFIADDPPRVITYWQGPGGYSVKAGPAGHGTSRFEFSFSDPVRIDIYELGDDQPLSRFGAGDVVKITLEASDHTETHHTTQEPPG